MASTFEVERPHTLGADAFLNEMTHYELEKASQTFVEGAFVQWDSGYIAEAASPVAAAIGIAEEAGGNETSNGDGESAFIPFWVEHRFFANFLTAGAPVATPQVLAAADLLADTEIVKATISGTVYWFVNDTTGGTDGAKMIALQSDQHLRNPTAGSGAGRRAVIGDSDVRVLFSAINAIREDVT